MQVAWTSPPIAASLVSGYRVGYNGGNFQNVTSATSATLTGLTSGTTYTVTVETLINYLGRTSPPFSASLKTLSSESQACNDNSECDGSLQLECPNPGSGSRVCRCKTGFYWRSSDCLSISTLLPQNIITSVVATNQFVVSWAQPSTQPPHPFTYVVTWWRMQNVTLGEHNANNTVTDHVIAGLTPGDAILVAVDTLINEGFRTQSTNSSRSTVNLRPEKPVGLVVGASVYRNDSMTLVFDGVQLGLADTYRVTLNNVTKEVLDNVNTNGTTARLNVSFEVLRPGTTYPLTIVAVSHGVVGETFTTSVRTNSTGPSMVTGFNITNVTATSMAVTWSQPQETNGYLFAYVLHVLRGTDCVKNVVFNCTSCNGTGMVETSQCSGQTPIIITSQDIRNANHTLTYAVDGLEPYVNYTVVIYGYTDGGKGMDTEEIRSTTIDAARPPEEVTATAVNSSAISLTWKPQRPKPGPTTYNITVLERDAHDGRTYFTVHSFNVSDFERNQSYITDLKSYWEYNISIKASTEVMESAVVQTTGSPTMSEPGHVAVFKVNKKSFTAVIIDVLCPILTNRNGKIDKYMIKYTRTPWDSESATPTTESPMPQDITEGSYCSSKDRTLVPPVSKEITIIPESNYSFTVQAVNSENMRGLTNSSDYSAEPGPPPDIPSISRPTPSPQTFDTYIVVPVCRSCLLNPTNGIIRYAGVVMCKEGLSCSNSRKRRNLQYVKDYKRLPNYTTAAQNEFNAEFRATDDDFVNMLRGQGSTTYNVEVGKSGGGLPRGVTFSVRIFTCTNGGCSQTVYVGGFSTNRDNVPPIVGGVIGGIAAAALVIALVVFILYKRKAGPWSNSRDRDSGVIIPDVPKQEIPRKRPVKLKDFNQHVYEMHKDSNLRFSEEFEDLTSLSPKHSKDVGSRDDIKVKNRYVNILPFDHSRVKLLPLSEHDSSDYINANYLPGYNTVREYIACQGPLVHTVPDLWRMIWEQKCNVIVCLSDLMEKGRAKVDQYWPSEVNSPEIYGEIEVETTSSSTLNKYVIRVFRVSLGDETRQVKQFFLPGWEDYSANLTPDDVIEFIKMVRLERKPSDTGPMVVHCSAGVGRTGTFIALDVVQQFIRDKELEAKLDIFGLVLRMRENRENMVQTEKQYTFIFDTTKEILDRKIKSQQEQDHIYGNDSNYGNDNIYENQGFTNDPSDIYVNMENGKPTTQL